LQVTTLQGLFWNRWGGYREMTAERNRAQAKLGPYFN
jgi:hypothetical protein